MDTSTEPSPGLFSAVRRLLNTALAGVENRIELFLVELREERFRVFDILLLGCAAGVLGFMALLTVTVTLVVIFWDSARVQVLQLHFHRQPVHGALQHQLPPAKLQALQLFSSKHARSFLSSSSVAEKDDQLRSRSFSRQRTTMVARE